MSALDNFMQENNSRKAACFMTISKYFEENGIKGVKRIEYSKNPLTTYKTADGQERTIKGIVFMDANKQQLSVIGVSERLSQKPIEEVAKMLGACRVLKDVVETQVDENETTTKTYWRLCSPGEIELNGDGVEIDL